jgi:hypothetical protein
MRVTWGSKREGFRALGYEKDVAVSGSQDQVSQIRVRGVPNGKGSGRWDTKKEIAGSRLVSASIP